MYSAKNNSRISPHAIFSNSDMTVASHCATVYLKIQIEGLLEIKRHRLTNQYIRIIPPSHYKPHTVNN